MKRDKKKILGNKSMMGITDEQISYIKRTKEAREHAQKGQEETAEAIGVARPTYTNYESIRPMPQKYIAKFCAYIGCSEHWLLTGRGLAFKSIKDEWVQDMANQLQSFNEEEREDYDSMMKIFMKGRKK